MGLILPAEMGLMKTVRIKTSEDAVLNAANWLRQHLDRPDYEWIEPDFEQYFGCRIVREPLEDFVFGKVYVEFDEQDAVAFVLRWS
jgi:hypothetical protein